MPMDLSQLRTKRTRWLAMPGQLDGVEVLVALATPAEAMRFRNQLVMKGIMPRDAQGLTAAIGHEDDLFREIASNYVLDWRVKEGYPPSTIQPEGAPYSAEQMGAVLANYPSAYHAVLLGVNEEQAFFTNGRGASTES
jgi:hypothetical protein